MVTAANTLLTTSTAQTSPYSLTTPVSIAYTLANDKKWTNLPGTPPDSNRNGPVIGGGPVSYNAYELSSTVSSGQTVSPRTAALTLASTALSTTGYTMMYEIRNADDVIRATQGSSAPWQYGDYHVALLGPSTSGTSPPFPRPRLSCSRSAGTILFTTSPTTRPSSARPRASSAPSRRSIIPRART